MLIFSSLKTKLLKHTMFGNTIYTVTNRKIVCFIERIAEDPKKGML